MTLDEDYTAGVLKGLPIFLVNREYNESTALSFMKVRYAVYLPNGYMVSVIEFYDRLNSGGYQYEMKIISDRVSYDIERGDAMFIHEMLTEIEKWEPESDRTLHF